MSTKRLLGVESGGVDIIAEPSRAEPSRAEPSRAEPSRAEPSRAEPSRAEPSRAEPSRAEPSRAEPSRAEPSRAEPSRAEPSRAEPSRAEPSRAEPSRAEPSRAALFVSSWLRRPGLLASLSESDLPARCTLAGVLRRVAAVALLLTLAAPVAAQPIIDSTQITEGETKTFTITVPSTWSTSLRIEDSSIAGAATATVDVCDLVDLFASSGIPHDWDVCYNHGPRSSRTFTIEIRANADSIDDPDETFNIRVTDVLNPFDHSFTITIREAGTTNPPPITFPAGSMPQIMLSQDTFQIDEPPADGCSDSHVGTEKTFHYNQNTGKLERVERHYGPRLTSVQYKVQLDRKPGPGKYVSVEIWEPTDLDRPDVRDGFNADGSIAHTGNFSQNAQIHGISWRGGQQGRISIAKSSLTFTDKNWNRSQTVTVNIRCAQHDVNNPLPIWHFAFRHDDRLINPGATHQYRLSDSVHAAGENRKGDNSRTNTSLKIAQVRVADSTEPAAITGNVEGKLVLDAYGSGFTTGGKKMISLEFNWNHPGNELHNDYDDAAEQFAAFRVRLRTVEPAGHKVQEKVVRVNAISPHDGKKTTTPWHAALEAKGHVGWVYGQPDPADSKYEWSVVPLDRRWNAVEDERVTKCVLLTSKAGSNGGRASRIDETATPTCPAALQGEGASAPAVSVPDTAVANLQVAEVNTASASVTWDAVAHATSYDVSWEAESSDTALSGDLPGVTGTTTTIEHGASVPMTLTVTVTPEYVDEHGDTQQLDSLAATATLTVGPGSDALSADAQSTDSQAPSCVSEALLADAQLATTETWRTSPGHVERWSRVLAAFGESNAYSNNPMTVTEAKAQADRGLKRWAPVVPALECLENPPEEEAQPAEEEPAMPATPELSLSAGAAVDEGGNATFTLTADPAPSSDLTMAFTVTQSGDYLDTPGAGPRTVVLTAGTTQTDLSVTTVDDGADEADGAVSVTLATGTGYTVAAAPDDTALVAVRDNDEPVISIVGGTGVTEGTDATFTVSASPVPAAPLDVMLTITQSGDFTSETGSRTITVPPSGSMSVEIATIDDGADEPDGSITATLDAGTGYLVAAPPENTALVAVSDNDAAASGPTISIADATMKENQRNGYFTVTLSEKVDWPVHVYYATRDSTPVSAVAGQDYLAWKRSWQLRARFRPGQTETQIHVPLYNDSHDEDPETFEMVLFDAGVNGPPGVSVSIADGVAIGTIVNSDPMPAAWLARFGRTVAEQALDGIAGRIAAPRTAGLQGAIAGQAMSLASGSQETHPDETGPDGSVGTVKGQDGGPSDVLRALGTGTGGTGYDVQAFGHDIHGYTDQPVQSYSMTVREALLGSHFTATGEQDPLGGSFAFWGRAAQSNFDGQEGTFSLDGETTSALLGIDYARSTWLLGLALIQSDGDGDYRDTDPGEDICEALDPVHLQGMDPKARAVLCSGAVREGDGEIEATLTAVMPYASIQVSQRLKLWGALGYGEGDVTLKPQTGGSLESDIDWSMATTGLRGDVIAPQGSGLALAITSDALWARTSSDKTHELASSDSDVTRLRLGLEGSYRIATKGGGHVTPKLELGLRQDGGDAETGFGVELGGGLTWVDPSLGLSLELSGRTLITHDSDDLEDRGFAASLLFDPKPATERGLSLVLRQEMGGQAEGGLDALFRVDPLEDRTGSGESTARWTAEAAYGMPAFSGRFTGSPHVGLDFAADTRNYSLGWRLTPAEGAPDISFGLKATRWESDAVRPEHTLGAEISIQW